MTYSPLTRSDDAAEYAAFDAQFAAEGKPEPLCHGPSLQDWRRLMESTPGRLPTCAEMLALVEECIDNGRWIESRAYSGRRNTRRSHAVNAQVSKLHGSE